jgi:protein-S-isoprenylcysteine O-methyltransferase Ste14
MIISANLCVILGFGIIFLVFKVNSYTSSIVIVKEGQFVVTTGPYAVVRHPMYAGSLLMIFFMPIALGSWVGLVFAVLFALLVIVRLLDEEKFLIKNLPGYREYIQKTRFRLVPYVW